MDLNNTAVQTIMKNTTQHNTTHTHADMLTVQTKFPLETEVRMILVEDIPCVILYNTQYM